MKYFLVTISFILILSGCSSNNAFSQFDMDRQQELSVNYRHSSKIESKNSVDGIFSAIYLNEVYPKLYSENEFFYMSLYLKDKNETDFRVKLNGKLPIEIEELESDNEFSYLDSIRSKWNRYYVLTFKKSAKKLNLVLESGQSSSAVLKYQKAEQ